MHTHVDIEISYLPCTEYLRQYDLPMNSLCPGAFEWLQVNTTCTIPNKPLAYSMTSQPSFGASGGLNPLSRPLPCQFTSRAIIGDN
ncbi:hypothetical protein I7I51_00950 [Histoplasma capsulatum]|uniref:Uncharacterized protein n=1 Tax=Ajellomyces capsulatus TaxID=5037 RepID=A0A8A1MFF5_AJECA|nr:hypothetical protein I7I51_00950 [Histoplasma capsulatum]